MADKRADKGADRREHLSPEGLLQWAGGMVEHLLDLAEGRRIRIRYVPRGGFVPAYLLAAGLWGRGEFDPPRPLAEEAQSAVDDFVVVADDVVDTGAAMGRVRALFCDDESRWAFVVPAVKGDWEEGRGLALCGEEARVPKDVWVVFPWEENWPEGGAD